MRTSMVVAVSAATLCVCVSVVALVSGKVGDLALWYAGFATGWCLNHLWQVYKPCVLIRRVEAAMADGAVLHFRLSRGGEE